MTSLFLDPHTLHYLPLSLWFGVGIDVVIQFRRQGIPSPYGFVFAGAAILGIGYALLHLFGYFPIPPTSVFAQSSAVFSSLCALGVGIGVDRIKRNSRDRRK